MPSCSASARFALHRLLAVSLLLGLTAFARADSYRVETQVYVLPSRDLPATSAADSAAADRKTTLVLHAPATLAFARDTLALTGGNLVWNGGAQPPVGLELATALPPMALAPGQPLTLSSSSATQYLEAAPGGGYKLTEIPADSPDAPKCRFVFALRPSAAATGPLELDAQLMLDTVRAREPVPTVALDVGKPLLARFNESLALTARPGDWTALLLRAPNGSDYSVLILLRLTSPAALARQLTKIAEYHLRTPRAGAAVVADDRSLYVAGGANLSGMLDTIERFDVQTQEATVLPAKLIPRHHHGAALIAGKIYLVGGIGYAPQGTNPIEPALEILDLASGQVTRGQPMPHAATTFGCVAVDGRLYAIGGFYERHTNRTLVYDLAANTWSAGPAMPTNRGKCPPVVARDLIVVAGGYRAPRISSGLDTVEAFNPRLGQWRSLPNLGARVSAHAAAALDDCLFLFGDYAATDRIVAYDLVTHDTTILSGRVTGVAESAAVTVGDKIYVIGGRDRTDVADLIQVFALRPPPP